VTAQASKPSKRDRALRLAACICVGLLFAVPLYVGLAMSGVIRSPFFPRADGDLALAKSDRPGLRVLFVGNSFTYYNEMPAMVGELAAEDHGAGPLYSVEYTAPNWSLHEASDTEGLDNLIDEVQWDVVVLQDVSYHLANPPEWWSRETLPYAAALRREIASNGGETMFFMTWGYEHGAYSDDSYDSMQARLAQGYESLAGALSSEVVPVGLAWASALSDRPGLDLWKRDGRHPNRAGSYLAACVFYRELTGRDPLNSDFTGGLEKADARFLQTIAGDAVDEYEATR
jgi:Domain of unknown function (DUF4886)